MFCNFLRTAIEYGKTQTRFFRALGPETEEKINCRKTKFALTCSFRKVIRALAFSGREKIRQFSLFQNSLYSVIASSISFNLI